MKPGKVFFKVLALNLLISGTDDSFLTMTMNFDVFNGDADGICALIQLRLALPRQALLVTGVKREINLLARVSAEAGDQVCVLDISLDSNRSALLDLLDKQVEVFYADHHFAGEIPQHHCLTSLIDTDADVCTSLLVNGYLKGRFSEWAVTGAFGDNLDGSALQAAQALQLAERQLEQLRQLGICLNYNAYGANLDDLHHAPDQLYRRLAEYGSPLDFIADQAQLYRQLLAAYADDMSLAQSTQAEFQNQDIAVFILPDEKWARRVSGAWGNELANRHPDRAHAVLSDNQRGAYQVSVRAPLNNKTGADQLCARFPEGGGRKAAAGINHLPPAQLTAFIEAFKLQYRHGRKPE